MSGTTGGEASCRIVVAELFSKINAQRKLLNQLPIEDRAMISRCSLRFNLDSHQKIDFTSGKIELDEHDVQVLEKVVNELFSVHFSGDIKKLCEKRPAAVMKDAPAVTKPVPSPVAETPATKPEKHGIGSRIWGMFSNK